MELSINELSQLIERNSINTDHEPDRDYVNNPDENLSPWVVDEWYLIRTVTMIQSGRLVSCGDKELVLEEATWIADTGRFHDCLQDASVIEEAEPFVGPCIINRSAIVDATTFHRGRICQK